VTPQHCGIRHEAPKGTTWKVVEHHCSEKSNPTRSHIAPTRSWYLVLINNNRCQIRISHFCNSRFACYIPHFTLHNYCIILHFTCPDSMIHIYISQNINLHCNPIIRISFYMIQYRILMKIMKHTSASMNLPLVSTPGTKLQLNTGGRHWFSSNFYWNSLESIGIHWIPAAAVSITKSDENERKSMQTQQTPLG